MLTKAIDDEYQGRDEQVVKEAVASGTRQKYAVAGALIITTVLTVVFVLATRRRLKAHMEADFAAERQRKAELETLSVRFGVATRAARAGVYELKRRWCGFVVERQHVRAVRSVAAELSAERSPRGSN